MSGFKAYFNAETMAGRANVAKATYATIGLMYLYFKIRGRSKKVENPVSPSLALVEPPQPVPPMCAPSHVPKEHAQEHESSATASARTQSYEYIRIPPPGYEDEHLFRDGPY